MTWEPLRPLSSSANLRIFSLGKRTNLWHYRWTRVCRQASVPSTVSSATLRSLPRRLELVQRQVASRSQPCSLSLQSFCSHRLLQKPHTHTHTHTHTHVIRHVSPANLVDHSSHFTASNSLNATYKPVPAVADYMISLWTQPSYSGIKTRPKRATIWDGTALMPAMPLFRPNLTVLGEVHRNGCWPQIVDISFGQNRQQPDFEVKMHPNLISTHSPLGDLDAPRPQGSGIVIHSIALNAFGV